MVATAVKLVLSVELIDPMLAKKYLDTMRFNRPEDLDKTDDYANQMLDGKWNPFSRYIEFTEEGDLINGRHRLKAIIKSGTSQWFVVVRGLPVCTR